MNHQIRIVTSESMEKGSKETNQYKIKSLPLKSMIIIEQVDNNHEYEWYQSLKVGDVLTFKYVYIKQETITHRIINIEDVLHYKEIIKILKVIHLLKQLIQEILIVLIT